MKFVPAKNPSAKTKPTVDAPQSTDLLKTTLDVLTTELRRGRESAEERTEELVETIAKHVSELTHTIKTQPPPSTSGVETRQLLETIRDAIRSTQKPPTPAAGYKLRIHRDARGDMEVVDVTRILAH